MPSSDRVSYLAAFPAGFRPLIDRLVLRDFGAAVEDGDDSTVLFRSNQPFRNPGYFQNYHLVLDRFKTVDLADAFRRFADRADATRWPSLDAFGLSAAGGRGNQSGSRYAGRRRFVLRAFLQGQPEAVPVPARARLERLIADRWSLVPDSQRPEMEFLVSIRTNGRAFFMMASNRAKSEKVDSGALPTATARLLNELGEPRPDDVFLDPFCGSGSLALERSLMAPYRFIFAGDRQNELVEGLKTRLKSSKFASRRRTIFPKLIDARDLSRFDNEFFTVILTDPPWGLYEGFSAGETIDLYTEFLTEARRVLAADGRLVLLVNRDQVLETAIDRSGSTWRIAEEFAILISGRKARAVAMKFAI